MNQSRRKELKQCYQAIRVQLTILESIKNDEQDAFDNLPEGIQWSEKGGDMEINIGEIESVISDFEAALEKFKKINNEV